MQTFATLCSILTYICGIIAQHSVSVPGQGGLRSNHSDLFSPQKRKASDGRRQQGPTSDSLGAVCLHAVNFVVIHELLEVVQVVPPLEEESLSDEAEPRCDEELPALGLFQHLLQLLLAHVAVALDLVGVWTQLHVLSKG